MTSHTITSSDRGPRDPCVLKLVKLRELLPQLPWPSGRNWSEVQGLINLRHGVCIYADHIERASRVGEGLRRRIGRHISRLVILAR